jgi:glyoxylase-like metal-dependent hydrolase (beta-lactamase superfamily II)
MVIDAQATPRKARDVLARVRQITDKPVRYVLLTHYHAVRVLGASGYGADQIIAAHPTYEMIVERGEEDWASEFQRFPRLFQGHEEIPGLTWPTLTFDSRMTVDLGARKVELMHLGGGHTRGDCVAWLPAERVLYSGDLVEASATPYCGDAQLAEWPLTLEWLSAMKPEKLVPGRGPALKTNAEAEIAIRDTKEFVQRLYDGTMREVARGAELKAAYETVYNAMAPAYDQWTIFEHCMPFNVARAFDESRGITHPAIWTDKKDIEMWQALKG